MMDFFTARKYGDLKYEISHTGDKYSFGNLKSITIMQSWDRRFVKLMRREKIERLAILIGDGWKDTDIGFLEELKGLNIREFIFTPYQIIPDISPIIHLDKLESFISYAKFNSAPDFSKMSRLKSLKLDWRASAKSIFNCEDLEHLGVVDYPYKDLTAFKNMGSLTSLSIKSAKLTSLKGIECLPNLKDLALNSRKLLSLDGIEHLRKLEELWLMSCRELDTLIALKGLKELSRIDLIFCNSLESLQGVETLPLLKKLEIRRCKNLNENSPYADMGSVTFNDLV